MVNFSTALIAALLNTVTVTALPSSSSLDGMSTPVIYGHKDGCCLLSPDSDVVYESNCKKLSSFEGVDAYSCPDVGEIEYKYNADNPAHSQVRISQNSGLKEPFYIHGWCEETTSWTPVAYCPTSAQKDEPSIRPFLDDFAGCKEPEFRVVSYLGHAKCPA